MPAYGALSGDLYNMSSGQRSSGNPSYIPLIKPVGTIRADAGSDEEAGRNQPIAMQEPASKPEGIDIGGDEGQMQPGAQSDGNGTEIAAMPDQESVEGAIAYIADMRRIWLGDDDMSLSEKETFRRFVSSSSDPYDAAGKYVASLGISRRLGIPQQAAYAGLDSLSRYLVGTDFTPRDSSLADKWNASWKQVEIQELQDK